MDYSRQTPWHMASMTIRALVGLPAQEGPNPPAEDGIANAKRAATRGAGAGTTDSTMLLSHDAFRALFSRVPGDIYTPMAVVACYLGLSRATVEHKLASRFGRGRVWRALLSAQHDSQAQPMKAGGLRWSFVVGELEVMLTDELVRADEQRQWGRVPARKARRDPRRDPIVRLGGTLDGLMFVVDTRGRVVGALGQQGMPALTLINALGDGGWLARLPPIEALSLPWTSLRAREPWDKVVVEALRLHVQTIEGRLLDGLEATRVALGHGGVAVDTGKGIA